jgi:Metallo-peptidase family M12
MSLPRASRLVLAALTLGLTANVVGTVPAATAAPAPGAPTTAVPATDLFTPLSSVSLEGDRVRVEPTDYAAFSVDVADLGAELSNAPTTTGRGAFEIAVPDPSGALQRFAVVETVVGEPGFEALHPEIRTYAGNAVDDASRSIRMDVTPMGFHASVRSPGAGQSWYVDPAFNRRGETRHLSYYGAAVPESSELFVERDLEDTADAVAAAAEEIGPPDGPVTRKSFRLALVTDPSFATYFGAANVSAEKATLINRVNQVYMDDMAIQFLLIADNDLLNLDSAAVATEDGGPCGASACFTPELLAGGCTGELLDRNTFVTGQIVGADAFDIGHIGLGINGGGIAGLGVVGGASKAQGCTGLPTPEGDFFAIDYVAHELGHQMGGDHTFNGTQQNCSSTNRALFPGTTQVEPGSGSSVMAYAGICQQDNLQPHSDPYFSFVSVEQVTDVVTADSTTIDEQQVVNLEGFDSGEAFTISCDGCATSDPVVNGPTTYNNVTVANAVSQATGETVTPLEINDYEVMFPDVSSPSTAGFTVDFALLGAGVDVPELTLTPTTGTFEWFTGTIINGGETTNQGTSSTTGNTNPVVVAPANRTIPIRTPFTLTGSGTDDDGDPLVYLWEQTDPGVLTGTSLVSNTKTEGPLFRMFGTYADVSADETLQSPSPDVNLATSSPSRTFPDLPQVLADNTNAESGACPAAPAPPASGGASNVPVPTVDCYSEFLPTAAYADNVLTAGELNFRLSARDQVPTGGGYAFDDVTLTLDGSAGPFLVTSQATSGTTVEAGPLDVTWAVNGTDAAGLAPNVRITLSTDGGVSFPIELSSSTPNDGTQTVSIPDVSTTKARIRIEAVGNYFFDVNDASFQIGDSTPVPTVPDTTITAGPKAGSFVLSRRVTFAARSTVSPSTFRCTLDAKPLTCGASTRVRYRPGTHVFGVAARSMGGDLDPTPATRVFASPFNDGQLSRRTAGWRRVKDKGSYRGAYMLTSRRGQVLARNADGIVKVALVAHTGPGFGRVAVLLDGKRLKVVDLSSSTLRKRVLIPVGTFTGRRSGTFSIRTLDTKPVRVDGFGLLAKVRG